MQLACLTLLQGRASVEEMFPILLIAGIHAAMMAEESHAIGKSKYYYCEGLSLSCDDVRLEAV